MLRELFRAIVRPRDDDGRIVCLENRIRQIEITQETLMARIEDLAAIVVEVGAVVDAVVAHVADMQARLATADAEDPRIGEAVDTLSSLKGRLEAFLPVPAPEPAPAG